MTVAGRLPLQGVRVLDLSRLLPGGFCSQMLADFGAEVIKIEDTGLGDYVRLMPPYCDGPDDTARSALFLALNRNKRSVSLDLKAEAGRDALRRLARDADVLLESYRPGVLDRLGVGYDVLAQDNPGLVYCAITGYGLTGPYVERSGHDINYLARAGVLAMSGDADGPPVSAAAQIADLGGGALMAVAGILTALRERDGTPERPGSGHGQVVDISMFDGALAWMAMPAAQAFAEGRSQRRGEFPLAGAIACYRAYRCADGWVAIGAVESKFWAAWCEGVERPDLVDAQFAAPGSREHVQVAAVFASRTRDEWETFAADVDCCLEPVLELDEALDDEQVKARGLITELRQPGALDGIRVVGNPIRLARTPADERRLPAPALGADTTAVLLDAGFTEEEVEALVASGTARDAARSPSRA